MTRLLDMAFSCECSSDRWVRQPLTGMLKQLLTTTRTTIPVEYSLARVWQHMSISSPGLSARVNVSPSPQNTEDSPGADHSLVASRARQDAGVALLNAADFCEDVSVVAERLEGDAAEPCSARALRCGDWHGGEYGSCGKVREGLHLGLSSVRR